MIPIVPGETPCLACIYPDVPPHWKRRFPVIGAVSAMIANIGALEGIKLLTGAGIACLNRMLYVDTASMQMRQISIQRNPECSICGSQ